VPLAVARARLDVHLGPAPLSEVAGALDRLALGVEDPGGSAGVVTHDRPVVLAPDDLDGRRLGVLAASRLALGLLGLLGPLALPLELALQPRPGWAARSCCRAAASACLARRSASSVARSMTCWVACSDAATARSVRPSQVPHSSSRLRWSA
jgi:hypothetical protein